MKQRKLFYNAIIITCDDNFTIIENGAIGIDEKKIIHIGEMPEDTDDYDEMTDMKGNIILPGLINTHGHTPMSLLRVCRRSPTANMAGRKIWPKEEQYTPEIAKWRLLIHCRND